MPERIQLRRTKGWRLPDGARSVARPTKWGNPWALGTSDDGVARTPEMVVIWYRDVLWRLEDDPDGRHGLPTLDTVRAELAGRDLACWCPVDAEWCHADVLLEAANSAVCSMCGDCCDRIRLPVETWLGLTDPEPETASQRFCSQHWHPIARSDEHIVVECDRFDPVGRLCMAYEDRPPICSGFPYYGRPPANGLTSERCSFRADFDLPIMLTRKVPL